MINDIGTLATLQRERYEGFVQQAALLRQVRGQKQIDKPRQVVASRPAQVNSVPTFYGLLLTALPARIRAILSY